MVFHEIFFVIQAGFPLTLVPAINHLPEHLGDLLGRQVMFIILRKISVNADTVDIGAKASETHNGTGFFT